MPFTAQDLIEGRQEPVSVMADAPVNEALALMIENDYSQLPVINDEKQPTGLITSDGILRGLSSFGVTIAQLRVRDVSEPVRTYSLDDNIFDLLEQLNVQPAVLIVDAEEHLVGIVTSHDTAAYFRRRAEDMMLVDDIESALREHISAAFTDKRTGETDQQALQKAIDEVSNARAFSGAREAISRYVRHWDGHKLNFQWVKEACSSLLRTGRSLDDLTLYQYTELLLHKSIWSDYKSSFSVDDKAIRKLLDDVRDTRNDLAHFRNEITRTQREQLKFCLRWLEQNPPIWPDPEAVDTVGETEEEQEAELMPVDAELSDRDSRYARLALYLQSQPMKVDTLRLSFNQIEEIIDYELPPSSQHRSWWANDSVAHAQSIQWLDAGWRVASVNLSGQVVRFARSKERELDYIDFFSSLLAKYRQQAEYPVRDVSPIGQNWLSVMSLPRVGNQLAMFAFAFTYSKRFRVELYLDTGDQATTKYVFDALHDQRDEIEREIGAELTWERLNSRRASRIALYTTGNVNDAEEDLARLCDWAADAMVRFQRALVNRADELLRTV